VTNKVRNTRSQQIVINLLWFLEDHTKQPSNFKVPKDLSWRNCGRMFRLQFN